MTAAPHSPTHDRRTHNVVSVHDVGADGSTGHRIGDGVLVFSDRVLVHPPLGEALASDGARALRIGISSGSGGDRVVEVIDVDRIVVSPASTDRPLVLLSLRTPSTCVVDYLGACSTDDFLDAVLTYFGSFDGRPPVRFNSNAGCPPMCVVDYDHPACSEC